MSLIGNGVQKAASPHQLCGGCQAGCEAAVHGMQRSFEDGRIEAVLLMDASNAFNRMNRQVALRNLLKLCPSIGTMLVKMHRILLTLH